MDGKYKAPKVFRWFEARLNSGPQNWKQYTVSLLVFNTVLFIFGFLVFALRPFMPLNPLCNGQEASPIQRSQRAAGFKCLADSTLSRARRNVDTFSSGRVSSIPSHSATFGAFFLPVAALGQL